MAYPFLPIIGFNQGQTKPAAPDVFTDYDETNDVTQQGGYNAIPKRTYGLNYKNPLTD